MLGKSIFFRSTLLAAIRTFPDFQQQQQRNVRVKFLNWLTSDGAADDGLWILPLAGLGLPSQNALILDGRDETGMESHRGQRVSGRGQGRVVVAIC